MVNLLLSVTFACGVAIAGLHVVNRRFIAPMYDVVLNLAAFLAAVASSVLLGHVLPAVFAALAVLAWLTLAVRTVRAAVAYGEPFVLPTNSPYPDGWWLAAAARVLVDFPEAVVDWPDYETA